VQRNQFFLLDWLTRRCIRLGDINATGSDVQLLIEHLKFNDLQEQARLLIDTINSNAPDQDQTVAPPLTIKREMQPDSQQASSCSTGSAASSSASIRRRNALQLSRENAGICLIINQHCFHRDVTEDLKVDMILSKYKNKPSYFLYRNIFRPKNYKNAMGRMWIKADLLRYFRQWVTMWSHMTM